MENHHDLNKYVVKLNRPPLPGRKQNFRKHQGVPLAWVCLTVFGCFFGTLADFSIYFTIYLKVDGWETEQFWTFLRPVEKAATTRQSVAARFCPSTLEGSFD